MIPTPLLSGCAEHFHDEFEDVYPDPLALSLTGTAIRVVRGVVAVVRKEERRQAGRRRSHREATPKRDRSAEESQGAQGSREDRQGPARPAKGLRSG